MITADRLQLAVFPGLVGVPNLDDDDRNGEPDWSQYGAAAGDNDFALATLFTDGSDVELVLSGSGIRVYEQDSIVLGQEAGDTVRVAGNIDEVAFRVEFDDFLTQGTLTVRDLSLQWQYDVALTASPLIFNHHLQELKKRWRWPSRHGVG